MMRRKPKPAAPPLLDPAAFDALPESVQRKCFSSLERLQIHYPHFVTAADTRPSLSRGLQRRQRVAANSPSPSLSPSPLPPRHPSPAETHFFRSLPDKVQRQCFSWEEQLYLARCCQPAAAAPRDPHLSGFRFGFAADADDSAGRLPLRSRSSSASLASVGRASLAISLQAHDGDEDASTASLLYISTPTPSTMAPPARRKRALSLTSPPLRDSPAPAMGMTDPPYFTLGPLPRHYRSHSTTPHARRSSFTQKPTPAPPAHQATPAIDPAARHYQDPEARRKLRMYLASPQKFDEALEFGFPAALSTPRTAGVDSGRPGVHPHYSLPPIDGHARKFSRDMHLFLKDGSLAFLEESLLGDGAEDEGLESDEEGDEESVDESEAPATPSSGGLSFRLQTHSRVRGGAGGKQSLESQRHGPAFLHSRGYGGAGGLEREMTLRMTLTRSDLRADDDALYGWQATYHSANASRAHSRSQSQGQNQTQSQSQSQSHTAFTIKPQGLHQADNDKVKPSLDADDPLALEHLVLTDDMTGTTGAFYVKPRPKGGLVARLWKRASLMR